MNIEKINQLREMADIPLNCGEQFITVLLDISTMSRGEIRYGFDWKNHMGEFSFSSLDEAIEEIEKLKKEFNSK